MKHKIGAIIFDFDGTIVDTKKSDLFALNKVIESLPEKINTDLFIKQSINRLVEFHNLVDDGIENPLNMHRYRLKKTFSDLNCEYSDYFLKIYLDTFHNTPCLFSKVENLLEKLQGRVKLAIFSNAHDSKEQNLRIDKANLRKYFDDIVIASDINIYKPNPMAFLYFETKYQLKADSFLVIGDSEKHDIVGASLAGMHSIKINFEHNCNKTAADYCCVDYQSLSDLLDEYYI